MRKTFKLFCAAAIAALTVSSCGKIWDEFDSVHGELDKLSDRITELETMLNSQVETINKTIGTLNAAVDAVEAKVAVVAVVKKDNGNYLLTFSNGETLEIAAADANANNTGLVTTITEGDVTYWAVVGKDGKAVKLDAVVHPDTKLSFKVNPETNELLVSYDGKDYEPTGVIVNDETTFNVVEGFVDADDHVVITVGGVEYKLPKVSACYFEIVSGMQYFAEWETKVIPVDMSGVVSSMVASAPEGWEVELTKEGLEVTASDNWNSGTIVVWVVTKDGQTKVGTVKVACTMNGYLTKYSFANNFKDVTVNFASNDAIYFGVVKASEYDADAIVEAVLASQDLEDMAEGVFANGIDPDDEWGENYLLEGEYKLAELLGSEPVPGETYTFWSVLPTWERDPMDWMSPPTMSVAAEDIVLEDVKVYTLSVDAEASYNDAALVVDAKGIDKYYLGFIELSWSNMFFNYGMIDPTDIPMSLLMIEEMLYYQGMTFGDLMLDGWATGGPGGNAFLAEGDVFEAGFEGNLSDILNCVPGTEYAVIALPMEAGKTLADYSAADYVALESIKLESLKYDGTATVTFADAATNVTSSSFDLAIESTGDCVYYAITEAGEFDTTDPDLIIDVVENYLSFFTLVKESSFVVKATETMWDTPFMPGMEYEVVAFAVSAEGQCSNVVSKVVSTKEFAYNTDVKVTSVTASAADEVGTAVINITGTPAKLYYYVTVTSLCPSPEDEEYDEYLQTLVFNSFDPNATSSIPVEVELTSENFSNGVATVKFDVGNERERVVFAFVQAADGSYSKPVRSNTFHDATQE